MIQVRCPKCNTGLSLQQPPPAGKVKCPKCATVIAVGKAPAAAAAQPVARQPTRQTPAGMGGEIDFGSIPTPAAPPIGGNFPSHYAPRVYDGPVQLDPIPVQKTGEEDEDDDEHESQPTEPAPKKKKGKKSSPIRLIIGVVVFILLIALIGGILYWRFGSAANVGAAVDQATGTQ